MSVFAKQLEKKIEGKISAIARGEIQAKGSGVNDLIVRLKQVDEVSATEMQKKYIIAVKAVQKS